jgi:hypothetical protein
MSNKLIINKSSMDYKAEVAVHYTIFVHQCSRNCQRTTDLQEVIFQTFLFY